VTRILLIIPTLDASGAEKQFATLAAGLPQDEFEVHAVALTRGGPFASMLAEADVPLTVLHKRFKFDPIALLRLRSLIERLKPDIVHTWMFTANSYGRLAVPSKGSRPKIVISERCVDSWKSGWQYRIDRHLADRTDCLIANSSSVADFYAEKGFDRECIRVIGNFVELARPAAERRNAVRKEIDVPLDAKLIGYVGRLAKQKRVHDLIWAVQLAKQLVENVKLVVVGDGPERSRLEELVRHYGCEDLTYFLGHREDAKRYMPAFDVFWLGSEFEGMSNSLMEAMAVGLPCVASDIPPNRELITNGENGFLAPLGDSVAFAQFTARIFDDPEQAGRIGEAARNRMRTEFTAQRMIEQHASLYRELGGLTGRPIRVTLRVSRAKLRDVRSAPAVAACRDRTRRHASAQGAFANTAG